MSAPLLQRLVLAKHWSQTSQRYTRHLIGKTGLGSFLLLNPLLFNVPICREPLFYDLDLNIPANLKAYSKCFIVFIR